MEDDIRQSSRTGTPALHQYAIWVATIVEESFSIDDPELFCESRMQSGQALVSSCVFLFSVIQAEENKLCGLATRKETETG